MRPARLLLPTAVALALATALAGCARHARGARLSFEKQFDCRADSVEKVDDRWVVTGCRRRAEYACGLRSGHSGDPGYANCHLEGLHEPRLARTFSKGVRVESGADGQPLVRARTGRPAPRIELQASPATAPDVAEWRVDAAAAAPCDQPPRVWIDGTEIPAADYARTEEGGRVEHRFRTPLSPLRASAEARRLRLDLCAEPLVLADAERQVVADFAIRATEGR